MRKQTFRKVILFLICVTILGGTVSCGNAKAEAESNHLLIYSDSGTKRMAKKLVDIFGVYNKETTIEIVDLSNLSEQEYTTKLSAELVSGNGPDLILMDERFLHTRDVYKMMQAGAFLDLEPYFEREQFNWDLYPKAVMDAGVWKEKRLVVPLGYNLPFMLSGEKMLADSSFTEQSMSNGLDFMRAMAKNNMEWRAGKAVPTFGGVDQFQYYFEMMGVRPFDYEKKKLDLDDPRLKEAAELYKECYAEIHRDPPALKDTEGRWYENKFQERVFEGYFYENSLLQVTFDMGQVQTFDEPAFFSFRNMDGKTEARIKFALSVNQNTKNPEAAFQMVKLALDNYQTNVTEEDSLPVKKGIAYYQNIYPLRFVQSVKLAYGVTSGTYDIGAVYTDQTGERIELYSGDVCQNISEELANYTQSVVENPESAYFPTPSTNQLFLMMQPYFEGKESYEKCLSEFQKKYNIYMSE